MNYVRCLARRRLHRPAHNLVVPVLNTFGKQLCHMQLYVLSQRSICRQGDISTLPILSRGSREKAGITCSKLDKKTRLMTRQYSSSRNTEALQPFTHSPLAAANRRCPSVVKLITVVLSKPKQNPNTANDKQKSQCCDY